MSNPTKPRRRTQFTAPQAREWNTLLSDLGGDLDAALTEIIEGYAEDLYLVHAEITPAHWRLVHAETPGGMHHVYATDQVTLTEVTTYETADEAANAFNAARDEVTSVLTEQLVDALANLSRWSTKDLAPDADEAGYGDRELGSAIVAVVELWDGLTDVADIAAAVPSDADLLRIAASRLTADDVAALLDARHPDHAAILTLVALR